MSVWAGAPSWLLVGIGVAAAVVLLLFVFAYTYCLFRQPDALRSEQFTLSKLAIEKGLVGDNVAGLMRYEAAQRVRDASLPAPVGGDRQKP